MSQYSVQQAAPPIWRRRPRTIRTLVAAGALGAFALPVALGLGPSGATGLTVPQARVALPTEAEMFSPYQPQVTCDPVAKPGVAAFRQQLLAAYGRGRDLGVVRSCAIGGASEHKEGRAWDWGVNYRNGSDREAARRALDWLLADDALNARRTGIMYLIWNRQIWSSYRRAEGWRPYRGANPHTDHVHFSFSWAGAMQRTSWWTGIVSPIEYGPCIRVLGMRALPYRTEINLLPCPRPARTEQEAALAAAQATELADAARRTAEQAQDAAAHELDAGPGVAYEPGGEGLYGTEGAAAAEAAYSAYLAEEAAHLAAGEAAAWEDGSAPEQMQFTPPPAP